MDPINFPKSPPCQTIEIFEALERVNSAIVRADSHRAMLEEVLDSMLDIFDCSRAWLLYPCSPTTQYYRIPMERTRPEFPGAGQITQELQADDEARLVFTKALESSEPVPLVPETEAAEVMEMMKDAFGVDSMLTMAIYPGSDSPWLLGIHHCDGPKSYDHSSALFKAIGRRVADGLTTLQATSQLRDSEQLLRTVIEHAPEAIVTIDCDTGNFIQANPMAEKLFGLPRNELIETFGPARFSPEFQSDGQRSEERVQHLLGAALAGEFPIFEWDHIDHKGRAIICEVRLAGLPDPNRKLVLGSVTDITERKQAEREHIELEAHLAQAQKMEAIGNLTGGLAHDFNNLLTVILGNLDLLDMEPGNQKFVAEQSQRIRSAAERAGTLTHRLLAFARRQPLRPQVLNFGTLLRGMDDLLRRTIGEQIQVETVLSGGLWLSEVDGMQLESAVLNLAVNARDAMPSGGKLTIEASNARLDAEYANQHEEVEEGQYVLLAVTDSGTGIAPDLLTKIFAPFYSTKPPGKGTGLGLSMVYGFVKQSGGHLKAYSEPGVGTTMKLYFPRVIASGEEGSNKLKAITARQGNGELILVVEDEDTVRQLTLVLVKQLGYRSLEASCAEDALALLTKHPEIDLLLTDVVLAGDKTGAEIANIARESRPDLRVLFMSGYTENAIIHNGRLDRDVFLLEKPFTKAALSMRIREALAEDR